MVQASVQDRLLHQAAVDPDFRAELEADPETFGTSSDQLALPAAVRRQDQSFLEAVGDGMAGGAIFACISTCSFGPFTIICEANTKG